MSTQASVSPRQSTLSAFWRFRPGLFYFDLSWICFDLWQYFQENPWDYLNKKSSEFGNEPGRILHRLDYSSRIYVTRTFDDRWFHHRQKHSQMETHLLLNVYLNWLIDLLEWVQFDRWIKIKREAVIMTVSSNEALVILILDMLWHEPGKSSFFTETCYGDLISLLVVFNVNCNSEESWIRLKIRQNRLDSKIREFRMDYLFYSLEREWFFEF